MKNKRLRKILHNSGIIISPSFTMMKKNEEADIYEKIKRYGEIIIKGFEDGLESEGKQNENGEKNKEDAED